MTDRFNAEDALRPLKAFQRKTVDYVSKRLLSDPDAVRHFLVADEVGLGKTMVARSVIARTIKALQDKVPRIDIVFVCSNGAIAKQNVATERHRRRTYLRPAHAADRSRRRRHAAPESETATCAVRGGLGTGPPSDHE